MYTKNQVVEIGAGRCVNCPTVQVFDSWTGDVTDPNSPSTTVTLTYDKTVIANYVDSLNSKCGDECHFYPEYDFDKDCVVNLKDFSMLTSEWLECNMPMCD